MPVVRIRALPQRGIDVRTVAQAVATALAAEIGQDPRGSWVTWETVEVYAEGDVTLGVEQPRDTHPPLAIVSAKRRPPEVIDAMLRCVGDTLVHELGLEPGNVFVTYEEIHPTSCTTRRPS
jgi:hypothetical protein